MHKSYAARVPEAKGLTHMLQLELNPTRRAGLRLAIKACGAQACNQGLHAQS